MNSHFPMVVGVGTVTAWRLSGTNFELFGWHSDWSFDLDFLRSFDVLLSDFGFLNKVAAEVLQRLDLGETNDDRVFL